MVSPEGGGPPVMLEHSREPPWAPERIVILGAGGFVGGAVAARLTADTVPVLTLGRTELDLLDADAAAHLAAILRPTDTLLVTAARAPCRTPAMMVANIHMMGAICRALNDIGPAHLVYVSSDAVYEDTPEPLTERSPTAPGSLHGAMHLAREQMLKAAYGGPLAILRPSLLYGLADPHDGYGPNRFRRLALAGAGITLFGEGEERRDHVLIDDAADLIRGVLYRRSRGVLNIVSGHVVSFREIAEHTVALLGSKSAVTGSPRTGPMPHDGYRPFDTTTRRRAFPELAPIPPAEGLARTCREALARAGRS
jgi:nucleoside-diphosphate-sugar epimerase